MTEVRKFSNHWAISDRFDALKGRRVRRKNGKVEYEVIGALSDPSLYDSYGFITYLIVLCRLSEGSSSRPVGSQTSIPETEFSYGFVEVAS